MFITHKMRHTGPQEITRDEYIVVCFDIGVSAAPDSNGAPAKGSLADTAAAPELLGAQAQQAAAPQPDAAVLPSAGAAGIGADPGAPAAAAAAGGSPSAVSIALSCAHCDAQQTHATAALPVVGPVLDCATVQLQLHNRHLLCVRRNTLYLGLTLRTGYLSQMPAATR